VCLDLKVRSPKSSIKEYFAQAIEPPDPQALESAIRGLIDLDALTSDEKTTRLGRLLTSMPLHPSLGRMIILGIIFRCLDPLLMLCAAAEETSLFRFPLGKEAEAYEAHSTFSKGYNSDAVTFIVAFCAAHDHLSRGRDEFDHFMEDNYLSSEAFWSINRAMSDIDLRLKHSGLVPWHNNSKLDFNQNSGNYPLIRALSIVGYRGNIASRVTGSSKYTTRGGEKAGIHNSSGNYPRKLGKLPLRIPHSALISYRKKVHSDWPLSKLHILKALCPCHLSREVPIPQPMKLS